MFTVRHAIFLATLFLPLASRSQEPDLDTRFPRYSINYTINQDGSYTEDRAWSMTVLKDQAIGYAKQQSISYSTSIQHAEILEAYTLKNDGRRLDVPKSNYQIEENRGRNEGAPVFSDWTKLSVVFPDVTVGDTVVFSYRLTATEPMFPGQFSKLDSFSNSSAFDDIHVKIDFPEALSMQYQARQMSEVKNTLSKGRRIVEWSYKNQAPVQNKRKNFSVYDVEREPGISLSTFKNYQQIATAYGERATPKAAVTDRVKKLAEDISKDKTDRVEVSRSLYEWVATNITYGGNCIGLGAVVPHDIDFILDNRMGDCKDHATLLQALLAAKGIESTQALVNAGNIYRLPQIPVVSSINHVINYVPSLGMYLDSTSNDTPFGMLPFSDADKPTLLVDGYKEGTKTPPIPVGSNQQHMKTLVKIQPDGSAIGEVSVELKGMFATIARGNLRDYSRDAERELVKNYFQAGGYIGSGVFTKESPKELVDTYKYGTSFDVKDFINVPGPGAFSIEPLFYSQAPISQYIAQAIMDIEETSESTCSSGRSVEEYRYEFPKSMKILAAPDDFRLERGNFMYSASYTLKSNVLEIKRIFDDRTPGNVCTAEQLAATKDFAQQAKSNFRAQVVYK